MEFTERQTSPYIPENAPVGRELPETTPVAVVTRKLTRGLMVAASLAELGDGHDVAMEPWGLYDTTMRFPSTERYAKDQPKYYGQLDMYSLRQKSHGDIFASLSFSLGTGIAARNDREASLVATISDEIILRQSGTDTGGEPVQHENRLDNEWPVTLETLTETPLSVLCTDIEARKAQNFGMHQIEVRADTSKGIWHEFDNRLPDRGFGDNMLLDPVKRKCLQGIIRAQFGLPITSMTDSRHDYSGPRNMQLIRSVVTAKELTRLFKTNFDREPLK